MFTKTKTKLDKAILLSIAAMLACNVVIMSQQLTSVPHFAAARSTPTQTA